MLGMRLGGVDPSILRELSGVYKPFVKAFKELVSNAFDADAETVQVRFEDDFSSVIVCDDGLGMTPFEFRGDFTRIGGGNRRWTGDKTRKGRPRIGSKGIGFLALARYCDRIIVESAANRNAEVEVRVAQTPATVNLFELFGVPIVASMWSDRLKCDVQASQPRNRKLREGKDFVLKRSRKVLSITKDCGPVLVKATFPCRGLGFRAVLDFDRLLQLADSADLEKLGDFASIEVFERATDKKEPGTRITAERLKPFVRKELRGERRKGFVRNVASRGGFEQFLWSFSRCTPISYGLDDAKNARVRKLMTARRQPTLTRLEVEHGKAVKALTRPLLPLEHDSAEIPPDLLVEVRIDERGLKASGFLAGYETVVYPAEYRGISVRVRGVSIGEPSFFGAESVLTGANKAALSQITGELLVSSGLDAVDALNPGRESFYEESEHYKALRRTLLGEGEKIGGCLGRVIAAVLRRSQVRSAYADTVGRASLRRKAIEDVSAAITNMMAQGGQQSSAMRRLLRCKGSHANGLASAPALDLGPPLRIGGMRIIASRNLPEPAEFDYVQEQIRLDTSRPEWNWQLLVFDRRFQVIHRQGRPDQAIAEVDFNAEKVFVNWGHPVKMQMDERGFLRTALAWVLAKEAASKDPQLMMELALRLLSFTTPSNG